MLPPPPPNPDNGMLTARVPVEHLPPSPPPPPAPVTATSTPITGKCRFFEKRQKTAVNGPFIFAGAPPPVAPPPPPPPPPSDQMNGLRITNGDLANNLKVWLAILAVL